MLFETLVKGILTEPLVEGGNEELIKFSDELKNISSKVLGRSIAIREVDAGSCNGCELEIHALNNPFYDIERFGIRFVASPRHADVLLVTGPVTKNMEDALLRTFNAMPSPKWVVSVGDCGATCGFFKGSYACAGAVADIIPVDLHVLGCPPEPINLLKGLAQLMEKIAG